MIKAVAGLRMGMEINRQTWALNAIACSYHVSTAGEIFSYISNRWLKPQEDQKGYLRVRLYYNKQSKWFRVHQLVWLKHGGHYPPDLQINHVNCNKQDNCIHNLELVTLQENVKHAKKNGRYKNKGRISDKLLIDLYDMHRHGKGVRELGRELKITHSTLIYHWKGLGLYED